MFPWERKEKVTERQQLFIDLADKGYTHQQIADMHNVSAQDVAQLCSMGRKRINKQKHLANFGSSKDGN